MRTLMIEAASVTSAQDIEATLLGFERELVADDGHYFVHVTLPAGDRGITAAVGVLDALQTYASEQGTSARMTLDGQSYTVEVPPPVAPPVVAPPLDV